MNTIIMENTDITTRNNATKIAICSTANLLESIVAEFFSKCDYFIIYNHESFESIAVKNNTKYKQSDKGEEAARILFDIGVDIALVPKLGPKAYKYLKEFGIDSYEYRKGISVRDALYDYFANESNLINQTKEKE